MGNIVVTNWLRTVASNDRIIRPAVESLWSPQLPFWSVYQNRSSSPQSVRSFQCNTWAWCKSCLQLFDIYAHISKHNFQCRVGSRIYLQQSPIKSNFNFTSHCKFVKAIVGLIRSSKIVCWSCKTSKLFNCVRVGELEVPRNQKTGLNFLGLFASFQTSILIRCVVSKVLFIGNGDA